MATLASPSSTNNNDEDDEEPLEKTHLLVAPESGVSRIAVNHILEELFESRNKHRLKCTRDSWVQTDFNCTLGAEASSSTVQDDEINQQLAPLASEEEFCSDNEQRAKVTSSEHTSCQQEVRQLNAIADLNQDAIQAQVAVMPGCRDKSERSIVYISLKKLLFHNVNAAHLAETLLYFQSIPKPETMCLGFLVLVDGRDASTAAWSELHQSLALVEESLPGTISLVLALGLSSHLSQSLSSKYLINHLKFESIVNENQLLTFISKDHLLTEFGGLCHYNHDDWIQFHELLDPFIISCHQMGCRLVKLIQDLREGHLPCVLTNTLIEQQRKQIMEVLEDEQLRYLEVEGSEFLQQLLKWREKFENNPDYEEAVDKSKLLFKQLKKVVQKLEKLANKRLNKLQECMMVKMFEKESSQILTWLSRKGEETLKKHKTLAESLNSIREQEQEFEKFYFLAMRQIERGNDLLEDIPKARAEKEVSSHLKQQLDDFTERLEDAREKLENTSRCYQLLDKAYEWCLETMRFVSHMKMDSATMKRLQSYLQKHPRLEDAFFEEMLQLATKLNNPTLLQQCRASKAKFVETVELVQARQRTLLEATERAKLLEETEAVMTDSVENFNIKPCLWNPVTSPSRNSSPSYIHSGRSSASSYTSFPSSYQSAGGYQKRLTNLPQHRNRSYMAKRGSLTEEMICKRVEEGHSQDFRLRKSFPFASDSLTSLNVPPSDETSSKPESLLNRDWKKCEKEMQKFADEIREQNELLEQKTLEDLRLQKSPILNADELQKPVLGNFNLTRCASCSDFEELLSTKSSTTEDFINNRTVMLIMTEMIQTERDYVKSLAYIIENYVPLLQSKDICQALRSQRNVVFGNIEKIYEFHSCYFLRELEQCDPYSVGQCFLKHDSQFYLYALYNKNKPKSDCLMAEYGNDFFKEKQRELGDKMDLASYLLKPVQRMGKYALLLKQLLKECPQINSEHYNNLKAAEEMVRFQLRHGNDLLAMDALKDCDVNIKEQGRLLRQDEFLVGKGKSRKALRQVFLFEDLIIFSKARRNPDCKGHEYYQYKNSMKTSDLGLTAQVGESPTKFEIWFRKCKIQDILVLQAPSAEIKNAWVEEITGLLWKQAERNRNLRMEEMCSMGVGNKPCLDITPSNNQICDRSISLQQLNKVPRFRNSLVLSSTDNLNDNELRRRSFGGSSIFYDNTVTTFYDLTEMNEEEKEKSVTVHSQCSAESGIFTDLSTSGDSYMENVQRMKMVERSDSLLSHASYDAKEISTTTSSLSGLEV